MKERENNTLKDYLGQSIWKPGEAKDLLSAKDAYNDPCPGRSQKSYSQINLNNKLMRKVNAHNSSLDMLKTREQAISEINKEVGYPFQSILSIGPVKLLKDHNQPKNHCLKWEANKPRPSIMDDIVKHDKKFHKQPPNQYFKTEMGKHIDINK